MNFANNLLNSYNNYLKFNKQWNLWLKNKYQTFDKLISIYNPQRTDMLHGLSTFKWPSNGVIEGDSSLFFKFVFSQEPEQCWDHQFIFSPFNSSRYTTYTVKFEGRKREFLYWR